MKYKDFIFILLVLFLINPVYGVTIQIPDATLIEDNKFTQKFEPVQTTYFNRKNIKISPVIDVTQLFKQEQSIVRLTHNSGNNSQVAFSIRGFGDNAVANSLIVVDGFPLLNPSLLAPNFNSIALSDIENIEIIQGSEGVLWGDQAVGGVVNITTRHPEKKLFDINLGLGSFNKQYYNLFAADKFAHNIFLKAFGYTNKTNNDRQHNDQTDESLAMQVGIDYSSGTISFKAQVYEDTIQLPGGLSQQQYDENPRQAINFENDIHFRTPLYQFISKQTLINDWLLETRFERQATFGDGFRIASFERQDVENMLRIRLKGNIKKTKITLGYEGSTSDYLFESSKIQESAKALQNNLFVRTAWSAAKNIELITGARAVSQNNDIKSDNAFSSLDKTMVSEVGLAFYQGNEWKYFVRRSGNFRFPKANEETWSSQDVESLKLQTGISYELGGERKTARQKSQINIYQLALTDEIAFNPAQTETEPFGSYRNFPKTLRRGVTLTEQYYLTKKIMLNAQFNAVDARFIAGEFSGNQIPAIPSINGNMGASYDFIENWRIKYNGLYTGSTYASENDANEGNKIPAYWIHTLALQFIKKSYNVNVEVINLLNQTYSVYTRYDADLQSNTYYPGAGRNFLLTFKMDLT